MIRMEPMCMPCVLYRYGPRRGYSLSESMTAFVSCVNSHCHLLESCFVWSPPSLLSSGVLKLPDVHVSHVAWVCDVAPAERVGG
jgi:hypothetical protein